MNNATKERFMHRVSECSTHGSRRGVVELAPAYAPKAEEQLENCKAAAGRIMDRMKEVEAELATHGIYKPKSRGSQFSKKLNNLMRRGGPSSQQARALVEEYLRWARRFASVSDEASRLKKVVAARRPSHETPDEGLARFKRAAMQVLSEGQLRRVYRIMDNERAEQGAA